MRPPEGTKTWKGNLNKLGQKTGNNSHKVEGPMTEKDTPEGQKNGKDTRSPRKLKGRMRAEAFDVVQAEGDEPPRGNSFFTDPPRPGESSTKSSTGWGSA
jgi:hypothetical protein